MRKDKKEYIVCAAIHYNDNIIGYTHQPVNIERGFVITGLRHCNCIQIQKMLRMQNSHSKNTQGFLTSRNRFVDREEAYKIATEQGQIDPTIHNLLGDKLDSSDLY